MSENRRFERDTGDGSALAVEEVDTDDGRAWVATTHADGSRTEVLLSRDDACALGRRLLEIAGEEAISG
jgi:hypothetical protein